MKIVKVKCKDEIDRTVKYRGYNISAFEKYSGDGFSIIIYSPTGESTFDHKSSDSPTLKVLSQAIKYGQSVIDKNVPKKWVKP